MINTYNESSLHKTLKDFFAYRYDGKTEVQIDGYICDIVTKDNLIIEIQTAHLSSLNTKIENLVLSHKVLLVYPLCTTTFIQTVDKNGKIISRRKSPKKQTIYSIFGELYRLYNLFDDENFSLLVLTTEQLKIKQLTNEKVQSKQKSRRFKKNYIITDKQLLQIHDEILFNSREDFLKLLPKNLPEVFSSKNLQTTEVKNEANKMLWVLAKMNLIKIDHKEGKLIFYKKL